MNRVKDIFCPILLVSPLWACQVRKISLAKGMSGNQALALAEFAAGYYLESAIVSYEARVKHC